MVAFIVFMGGILFASVYGSFTMRRDMGGAQIQIERMKDLTKVMVIGGAVFVVLEGAAIVFARRSAKH